MLVWRKEKKWLLTFAIALGAILPDLPMFGFYAYQRLWAQRSEHEIWSTLYFDNDWQLFFDLFNSIPIAVGVIAICYWRGYRWGMLLAGSALLHMCCDLPVHHDDGHRHFLPFSDWKYESPISYWDFKHHGQVFLVIELLFTLGTCVFVGRKAKGLPMRVTAYSALVLYVAGLSFALWVWYAKS